MRPERLRCHNEEQRAADKEVMGHGDKEMKSKQCVGQRTHKDNTGVIDCKQDEEGGRLQLDACLSTESPLQAVTISLVLPKHRIHAGNNSHI